MEHSNEAYAIIRNLKIQVRVLYILTAILMSFFMVSFISTTGEEEVIRAKGIIIVDSEGRDRILIGAPFPVSGDRIRTDFEKSRAAWSHGFGGKFDWYKTNPKIIHSGTGMLILDEKGHDRVAIGSPVPSSFIGRIAPEHGNIINDDRGIERSGYGHLLGEGIDRVVLGLDHATGYEGLSVGVFEDGSTEICLNDPNNVNRVNILNDKGKIGKWYNYEDTVSGMVLKDTTGKAVKFYHMPAGQKK